MQMPAYIASVGMFTDTKTIFASPTMNDEMYQFQRELHECLHNFDKLLKIHTDMTAVTILSNQTVSNQVKDK